MMLEFRKTVVLIVCVLFSSITVYADTPTALPAPSDNPDPRTQLHAVSVSIHDIKKSLKAEKTQRELIQAELEESEDAINQANLSIYKLNQQMTVEAEQLSVLKAQAAQYQEKFNDAQTRLALHLKSAYILGLQPYLKLVLNQENPGQLSRILQYYRYFNQKELEALRELRSALDQLSQAEQALQAKQVEYAHMKQELVTEEQALTTAEANRQKAVTALDQTIQTQMGQLTNLLANKEALVRTIHGLQAAYSVPGIDFGKEQGKLPWPTSGRVLRLFGTPINNSQLRWDGTLIVAPEGQPVHAIAGGKVVFAKWLAGYGFLMIIDHGHGFMTLYGRNHALYQHVGDIVKAGDVIASVGKSGGYDTPALYFSIRHDAKPLNPMRWCH